VIDEAWDGLPARILDMGGVPSVRCSVNWIHYGKVWYMARKICAAGNFFTFSLNPVASIDYKVIAG
jgi:hypothetical protein